MFSRIINAIDDSDIPAGLSNDDVEALSQRSNDLFSCELPKGYREFLRKCNGLSDNGYSVFCYYNQDMEKEFPCYASLDFLSFNQNFRDFTDITDYLILGKSSIDYLAYAIKSSEYVIMTNGIMRIIEKSNKFEAILEHFFRID